MEAVLVKQVANSNSHVKSGKIEAAWQSSAAKNVSETYSVQLTSWPGMRMADSSLLYKTFI